MSLRFSLLGLVGLLSFAALACAALVRPGPQWLAVVVTLTVLMIGFQAIRAIVARDESRAAAIGWLVFALVYLLLTLGPWLSDHVGPTLLSSKAIAYAQANWRKESLENYASDYWGRINLNQVRAPLVLDGTSNTLVWTTGIDLSGWDYRPAPGAWWAEQPTPVNCFRASGQWLFAWLAGWLGAAIAVAFQRRSASRRAG
jgi:hypothetical protein